MFGRTPWQIHKYFSLGHSSLSLHSVSSSFFHSFVASAMQLQLAFNFPCRIFVTFRLLHFKIIKLVPTSSSSSSFLSLVRFFYDFDAFNRKKSLKIQTSIHTFETPWRCIYISLLINRMSSFPNCDSLFCRLYALASHSIHSRAVLGKLVVR